MKHITRYTNNLIDRMTRLPDSGLGRGLSIIAGVAGLILLVGQTYADIDVQTALSNNITTLQQLRTTITGIPTATWKVDISHLGIKLNIPTGPGVLQRDASDYIVLDLVSGSDVANNTITNTNINNNTIQTYNIANYAVTNNAISDNTLQCASLNIPGFNCAPLNQTCGTGLVLQGINASGSMFCTGATAGSGGGLPACGAGQSYVWTGGAWTCLSLLLSANDGSLWDYAPANSGDIYNKNYASGFVGVHTTNPTAELHDVGTFLVGGTGVISTGGWAYTGAGTGMTWVSGNIQYLYYDLYSAATGTNPWYPTCSCSWAGNCNNGVDLIMLSYPSTNQFNFGMTSTGFTGSPYAWDLADRTYYRSYYTGEYCQYYTPNCGSGLPCYMVQKKYASCTTTPAAVPPTTYRYVARYETAEYDPTCLLTGIVNTSWYVTFYSLAGMSWFIKGSIYMTGTYRGPSFCASATGSTIGMYTYPNIKKIYYIDRPSSTPYVATGSCTYIVSGSVNGFISGAALSGNYYSWAVPGATWTTYYSGNSCGVVGALATYSGNHIVYVTGGNVGILTNNPQHTLDVVGTVRSAALLITSDMRKKDNIVLIKGALRKLLRVHGYVYSLILDNTQHYWVLAQEIEKVFPTLVVTDENGTKAVRYNSLIGVIIESLQELNTTLTTNQNMLLDNEHMLQKLEK